MRPISESTVLVTGATDGLGRAVATELAGLGATVLLHGRDDPRGEQALRDIQAATGSERLVWYRADLASLAQVRDLAESVAAEQERLDVVVNNAGIGTTMGGDRRRMESADGNELRFAVNYLAPFLLTRLLEPLLMASAPSRIVNVTSAGQAPIRLRRRHARGALRRHPGLLPEQARARHAHPRPRRGAWRQRRHRQLSPPRHLHADQDGPRVGHEAARLPRERRRFHYAANRRSRTRARERTVLRT